MLNGQMAKMGIKLKPKVDLIKVNEEKINCHKFKFLSKLIKIKKLKVLLRSFYENFNRKALFHFSPQECKTSFYPLGILGHDRKGYVNLTNNRKLFYELSYSIFGHRRTYIVKLIGEFDKNSIKEKQGGVNLQEKKPSSFKINIKGNNPKNLFSELFSEDGINRKIERTTELLNYKVLDFKKLNFRNLFKKVLTGKYWRLTKYFFLGL